MGKITEVVKFIKGGSSPKGKWDMHIVKVDGEEMPYFRNPDNDPAPSVGLDVTVKVDAKGKAANPMSVNDRLQKTNEQIENNTVIDLLTEIRDILNRAFPTDTVDPLEGIEDEIPTD